MKRKLTPEKLEKIREFARKRTKTAAEFAKKLRISRTLLFTTIKDLKKRKKMMSATELKATVLATAASLSAETRKFGQKRRPTAKEVLKALKKSRRMTLSVRTVQRILRGMEIGKRTSTGTENEELSQQQFDALSKHCKRW